MTLIEALNKITTEHKMIQIEISVRFQLLLTYIALPLLCLWCFGFDEFFKYHMLIITILTINRLDRKQP